MSWENVAKFLWWWKACEYFAQKIWDGSAWHNKIVITNHEPDKEKAELSAPSEEKLSHVRNRKLTQYIMSWNNASTKALNVNRMSRCKGMRCSSTHKLYSWFLAERLRFLQWYVMHTTVNCILHSINHSSGVTICNCRSPSVMEFD